MLFSDVEREFKVFVEKETVKLREDLRDDEDGLLKKLIAQKMEKTAECKVEFVKSKVLSLLSRPQNTADSSLVKEEPSNLTSKNTKQTVSPVIP